MLAQVAARLTFGLMGPSSNPLSAQFAFLWREGRCNGFTIPTTQEWLNNRAFCLLEHYQSVAKVASWPLQAIESSGLDLNCSCFKFGSRIDSKVLERPNLTESLRTLLSLCKNIYPLKVEKNLRKKCLKTKLHLQLLLCSECNFDILLRMHEIRLMQDFVIFFESWG